MPFERSRSGGLAVVVAVVALVSAPGAWAQEPDGQGTDRFVTFVARECADYTDITANRARNDIQESLEDLGIDSPYRQGQPIDPGREAVDQPACKPISNWTFTLGTGIKTRAVPGPWGSLSIVTGAYPTAIVTQPSVPLRDLAGRPTSQTIEGAVTIELSAAEAAKAASGSSLWVQGGTTADPILNQQFPGQYGFGALRCAIDNLNGDNVEWISFPAGSQHVFCYAYYVTPPPTSGTITIRKEVRGVAGANEAFQFDGNLSFNANNRFQLGVQGGKAGSQTFYRAAVAEPWHARELVPDGWRLASLECTKQGASAITTDPATAAVSIVLAPRDNVTCTFANEPRPPAGQLFIRKLTSGGVGLFDFSITPLEGGGEERSATAKTTREELPADATPSPLELEPGRYRVRERLPSDARGRWRLDSVSCDGRRLQAEDGGVTVSIAPAAGATCTFANEFVPHGAIAIDKQTAGAAGSAGFVIAPVDDPETIYVQTAVTREAGVPARARGDNTATLPLGDYVIQEIEPHARDGQWQLVHVRCDGQLTPVVAGRVRVRLTRADPRVRCSFANVLRRSRPGPPIEPPGPNHVPGGPEPDLVISKRPDRPTAFVGERVGYSIVVHNRGPVAAEDVVVADQLGSGELLLSSDRERCSGSRLITCRIPALRAGDSVRLLFETRVTSAAPGTVRNLAVVGSASPEPIVRNNDALAALRTRRQPACPSSAERVDRQRARAAC